MNPLDYTPAEWKALGNEKYEATADALGANPSHSNYHFCAVLHAMRNDGAVSRRVLDGFDEHSRAILARASANEAERLQREAYRLRCQLAVLQARSLNRL